MKSADANHIGAGFHFFYPQVEACGKVRHARFAGCYQERSDMLRRNLLAIALLAAVARPGVSGADDFRPETVIELERAALDRWGKGDPFGYLEIYAPAITYFDPGQERRVDGLEAMTALLAPLKGLIKLDRYEIIAPDVFHSGDVAVLSFNLVTYGTRADGTPSETHWNTTSAFARVEGQWKIVHHHFSITKPDAK
jgi:ketosteroid isomerase-like protein